MRLKIFIGAMCLMVGFILGIYAVALFMGNPVEEKYELQRAVEVGAAEYDTKEHELVWTDQMVKYVCVGEEKDAKH